MLALALALSVALAISLQVLAVLHAKGALLVLFLMKDKELAKIVKQENILALNQIIVRSVLKGHMPLLLDQGLALHVDQVCGIIFLEVFQVLTAMFAMLERMLQKDLHIALHVNQVTTQESSLRIASLVQ